MNIEAVIGANYGDEGKGLFTAYLCKSKPNPIVVMSNGGCQRGHTVNDLCLGIRHVFHHFGSGTLLGVPSIYSKTFLLNPIKYIEEKLELESKGIKPIAFRAPGCILQLPSDMLTNQMVEKARKASNKIHGSCGWGIWETQVRNKEHRKLSFRDFAAMDYDAKRRCIIEAADWQMEIRLRGIYNELIDWHAFHLVKSDNFIRHFIQDFEEMRRTTILLGSDDIMNNDFSRYGIILSTIVIENAQGLLLDKKYAPLDENGLSNVHSTPSQCGIDGAIAALGRSIGRESIAANYISRTYFTRHGEGPFPEETNGLYFEDKTNMPNEWQGQMKFGKMDSNAFLKMQERALEDAKNCVRANIVMTHCNEVPVPFTASKFNCEFFSYEDNFRKVIER